MDVFNRGRDIGRKRGVERGISVHFAMSFLSCLDDQLKIQADYVDSFKMRLKKFTKFIFYKYNSNNRA